MRLSLSHSCSVCAACVCLVCCSVLFSRIILLFDFIVFFCFYFWHTHNLTPGRERMCKRDPCFGYAPFTDSTEHEKFIFLGTFHEHHPCSIIPHTSRLRLNVVSPCIRGTSTQSAQHMLKIDGFYWFMLRWWEDRFDGRNGEHAKRYMPSDGMAKKEGNDSKPFQRNADVFRLCMVCVCSFFRYKNNFIDVGNRLWLIQQS